MKADCECGEYCVAIVFAAAVERFVRFLCRLFDVLGIAIDAADDDHVLQSPGYKQLVVVYEAQIARAGASNRILAYHVCDWLVPTRDLLLDRGMMGDGVIDLPRIGRLIEKAGYRGFTEVEIFSANDWWKRPGDEVIRTCINRFNSVS